MPRNNSNEIAETVKSAQQDRDETIAKLATTAPEFFGGLMGVLGSIPQNYSEAERIECTRLALRTLISMLEARQNINKMPSTFAIAA